MNKLAEGNLDAVATEVVLQLKQTDGRFPAERF